jgi:hypothetical protein
VSTHSLAVPSARTGQRLTNSQPCEDSAPGSASSRISKLTLPPSSLPNQIQREAYSAGVRSYFCSQGSCLASSDRSSAQVFSSTWKLGSPLWAIGGAAPESGATTTTYSMSQTMVSCAFVMR